MTEFHYPSVTGLWVALGGGLGAVARFLLGSWISLWAAPGFPWSTFTVNVLGSALLGLLARGLAAPSASPGTRAFLAIGFCGGFTTFSAFDLDTLLLLQDARYGLAGLYSLGSVTTCIAGVLAGSWVAGERKTETRHGVAPGPDSAIPGRR
jgi:fluoride exporter